MLCVEFLEDYSDYCDGHMCAERRAEFEEHLAACPGCARYDRVLQRGVELLRALPGEGADEEFMPRLVHRLYNVDEGLHPTTHRFAGGAALVGVAAVGLLALFWLPFAASVPLELELEPLSARAPALAEPPALFRSGPFIAAVAVEVDYRVNPDFASWPSRLYDGDAAGLAGALRLAASRSQDR
jgi:anti-sigma factor RsiW